MLGSNQKRFMTIPSLAALTTLAPTLSGAKIHPPSPAGDSTSFNHFHPLSTIKPEKIS
jgi:hypothetical protein